MNALFPCIFEHICAGPHPVHRAIEFSNAANPEGLVVKCTSNGTIYASWSRTQWEVLDNWSGSNTLRMRTVRAERLHRSIIPDCHRVIKRGFQQTYTCPDCDRCAAKKCSSTVRRCIQHCTADRCPATGHTRRIHQQATARLRFVLLELTAFNTFNQTVHFTTSVLCATRGSAIGLLSLPSWAQSALRLHEIDLASLERFDPKVEDPHDAWQLTNQGGLPVSEDEGVLLRASLRSSFPRHFVADMAHGLTAAAVQFANDESADLLTIFAATFPDLKYFCLDEFLSIITLWTGLSPSVRAKYCDAGHTQGGTWSKLVANTQRH